MSGEKRFEPTQRKLKKAREDGDVAKSQDFTACIGTTIGFACVFSGLLGLTQISELFTECFALGRDFNSDNMLSLFIKSISVVGVVTLPALGVVLIAVFLAESLQVGFQFSFKSLAVKFSRLNLFQGLRRILGIEEEENQSPLPTKLCYEIGRLFLIILLLGLICGGFICWYFGPVLLAGYETVSDLVHVGNVLSQKLVMLAIGVFLVFAVADLIIVRRRRRTRLRMDAEELKKEFRETEGSPELKSLQKSLHEEMILQGVIEGVRRAKVVVVKGE